jgi:hypothetical protein
MNIHTPERGTDESAADYKARREASRKAVRAMTLANIGDQHRAPSSREQLRNSQRSNGKLRAGSYGRGLDNKWSNDAAKKQAKLPHYRDANGAFTLIGKRDFMNNENGRMWLAGISAQRGY